MPFDAMTGLTSEETVRTEAFEKQVATDLEAFNPYRAQDPVGSFVSWTLALCDHGRKQLSADEFALAANAYLRLENDQRPDVGKALGGRIDWLSFLATNDFDGYTRLFGG